MRHQKMGNKVDQSAGGRTRRHDEDVSLGLISPSSEDREDRRAEEEAFVVWMCDDLCEHQQPDGSKKVL